MASPASSLSGAGTFNPIEHGKPRASSIERVPVPKSGLSAPRNAANGHAIHALGPTDKGTKAATAPKPSQQAAGGHAPKGGAAKPGVVRISSPLGEVKLNVHKVTHGLAQAAVPPDRCATRTRAPTTVWSDSKASTTASNSTVQTAVTTSSGVTAGSSQLVGGEHDNSRDHGRCVQRRLRRRQRKFRWQDQRRQGQLR